MSTQQPIILSPSQYASFQDRGWIDEQGQMTPALEDALSKFVAEQFERINGPVDYEDAC